jgi:hypothetical protein
MSSPISPIAHSSGRNRESSAAESLGISAEAGAGGSFADSLRGAMEEMGSVAGSQAETKVAGVLSKATAPTCTAR